MSLENKMELSTVQLEQLLKALKDRFEKNMNRHKGIEWANLQAKLDAQAGVEKLWSLNEMEKTGGEPDVIGQDKTTGEYILIVQLKVRKGAEVFVTTIKGWNQGRNLNRKTMLMIGWQPWALNV